MLLAYPQREIPVLGPILRSSPDSSVQPAFIAPALLSEDSSSSSASWDKSSAVRELTQAREALYTKTRDLIVKVRDAIAQSTSLSQLLLINTENTALGLRYANFLNEIRVGIDTLTEESYQRFLNLVRTLDTDYESFLGRLRSAEYNSSFVAPELLEGSSIAAPSSKELLLKTRIRGLFNCVTLLLKSSELFRAQSPHRYAAHEYAARQEWKSVELGLQALEAETRSGFLPVAEGGLSPEGRLETFYLPVYNWMVWIWNLLVKRATEFPEAVQAVEQLTIEILQQLDRSSFTEPKLSQIDRINALMDRLEILLKMIALKIKDLPYVTCARTYLVHLDDPRRLMYGEEYPYRGKIYVVGEGLLSLERRAYDVSFDQVDFGEQNSEVEDETQEAVPEIDLNCENIGQYVDEAYQFDVITQDQLCDLPPGEIYVGPDRRAWHLPSLLQSIESGFALFDSISERIVPSYPKDLFAQHIHPRELSRVVATAKARGLFDLVQYPALSTFTQIQGLASGIYNFIKKYDKITKIYSDLLRGRAANPARGVAEVVGHPEDLGLPTRRDIYASRQLMQVCTGVGIDYPGARKFSDIPSQDGPGGTQIFYQSVLTDAFLGDSLNPTFDSQEGRTPQGLRWTTGAERCLTMTYQDDQGQQQTTNTSLIKSYVRAHFVLPRS